MTTDTTKTNQRRSPTTEPKTEDEKRTVRVVFKLNPIEEKRLDVLCSGIGRSHYIRAGLFSYSMPQPKADVPQINRDTYIELGRIGANLNQQTRAINEAVKTGLSPLLAEPYLAKLTDLEAKLKDLRAQLTQTQARDQGA